VAQAVRTWAPSSNPSTAKKNGRLTHERHKIVLCNKKNNVYILINIIFDCGTEMVLVDKVKFKFDPQIREILNK
jgi:ribosomal protein L32